MRKLDFQPTAPSTDLPVTGGDDTIDIEADTVEEAMARVAATFGEDAQIVDARKTVSGGIAGLFAKERVVLTVRRPRGGISSILEQMSRDIDAAETEFGEALRRRLAADDGADAGRSGVAPFGELTTAAGPLPVGGVIAAEGEGYSLTPIEGPFIEPAPLETALAGVVPSIAPMSLATAQPSALPTSSAEPVSAVEPPGTGAVAASKPPRAQAVPTPTPHGTGPVDWGRTELVRRGVPERIVSAVASVDPADDLAWIQSIAEAVAPMCGGPLDADGVVVGAAAAQIGDLLELDGVEPCGIAPYRGGFFTPAEGSYDEQKWLDFVLAGRPLHVVIDDTKAWGDLLVADPSVVSWIDSSGVAVALHLAATLGARLGFCPAQQPGGLVRATPVDVALAVRQLVRRK